MAVDAPDGVQLFDLVLTERSLLSSSTRSRIAALRSIQSHLESETLDDAQVLPIVSLLFETYPRYIDRPSRESAQQCLRALIAGASAEKSVQPLIDSLQREVAKGGIAPANAFVLVEWLWILLEGAASKQKLWVKWGKTLILADALAIEACLGSNGKPSMKRSALVVTRRALRKVFKSAGAGAVGDIVSALTARGAGPTARNAVMLGVVAGVCARLSGMTEPFAAVKGECFAFYNREIIGSRTILPPHIATGLFDLFHSFTTMDDLTKEIVPPIEKSLLRAPEVVLNDLVAPMIKALDPKHDLSEILLKNLLKPLLNNVKSTSATIRSGALNTFEAIASRSRNNALNDKITDDILNPLKQNKLTVADHKIIHARMLAAIMSSEAVAKKIISSVGPIALKEPNEGVIEAEAEAICKHVHFLLSSQSVLDQGVIETFTKGLTDKRNLVRRLWAIQVGDLFVKLDKHASVSPSASTLALAVLTKMVDSFKDVQANPLPSVQSGLATVAYVFITLSLATFRGTGDEKIKLLIDKAAVQKQLLVPDTKASLLLNVRVYTKLTDSIDVKWAIQALAATGSDIAAKSIDSVATTNAWSQAFLYFLTASGISSQMQKDALKTLAKIYAQLPQGLGQVVIAGVWSWRSSVVTDDKESAAISAKSGNRKIFEVLRAICPSPEELERHGVEIDPTIMGAQLLSMFILARPELLPHASWIEYCLRAGIDPGSLVRGKKAEFLNEVVSKTEYSGIDASSVHHAAYKAAADLAFVAPDDFIPALMERILSDLDSAQLQTIGPTEAAIYRTPEGTAYVDVLASKQPQVVSKNVKDYDTMKWEEELRAELAKKSGQKKKFTPDEQKKIAAQLAKESAIRQHVSKVASNFRRGVGIIQALATGPPTDEERWIVQAVTCLTDVIEAGAGLLLGDAATMTYLDCARGVTNRLGPLRPFIGVATLRAIGITQIPAEYLVEPLVDQITRILYRIRFLGEQRPFDVVSLAYMLPLIFIVLDKGGVADAGSDEADEQLTLALEFLSSHTEVCGSERLPRAKLLATLIMAMQRYTQHYKLIKDCLHDLCRSIEPTITPEETDILLRGVLVPQVSVREAILQAIDEQLDLSDLDFSEHIWLACHDDVAENAEVARTIWDESGFEDSESSLELTMTFLPSPDRQMRRAAARSLAESVQSFPDAFSRTTERMMVDYAEAAKVREPERDKFGMVKKGDVSDPWEARSGIALAFKELAPVFKPNDLVPYVRFLIERGPLADRNATVRDEMIDAATTVIAQQGATKVEELMTLMENVLENPDRGSETFDKVNEAVVILYGAIARHLQSGDKRVEKVVQRLMSTLSTPSESVQYAVAECLPPLVQSSMDKVPDYVQQLMDELHQSKSYASRRGAAYGLAAVIQGRGISSLRELRIMSSLKGAAENKKEVSQRQGTFLAYELFSLILGRVFEPYVIQIVPQLLIGFGDTSGDVRESCLDAAKACFATLSSYAVKKILPELLEGLEEQQWRSKKGACDSLGAMAYLDPQQLAVSLPEIIPPLTNVLNDSHKEVRLSAKRSLQRFGEVISNPEIKGVVDVLLKALSDPTKYTDEALDALIKVQFLHYLDAPSLALVVRILERGLGDRSATKRKASQIIGSLAHLTERKDLITHLPILVAGLRQAIVDPVPATRATASKALGSTVEKLGEDALPDLIPNLMATLKSDTGAGDRLGSAQALSEVLAGLGTARLEESLPTILQNVSSSKPAVREGFMTLFIFLPACFGNSFSNYLNRIIPPILAGLADDVESIRETALRAGRLLVKNFATRAIDLLLPELERGLADNSYRIRLSSVELVGDLLFNLTGITAKAEQEDAEEGAQEAGQSLLEILGEEKRNKVLSAIYICRCDTSGLVRSAAINVWKALVATPRTLREILPTLTQLIIRRLASSNMEQKVIAGNALGELIRKAGEGVLATLLPTLEEGLHSTDTDAKQGICIALREIIGSSAPEALEDYEKTLVSVVRTALVDADAEVRDAAAEAFDSLQRIIGKRVVDQVLPYLLSLLQSENEADNALAALLTLLTDTTRSNIILPNLLPTLLRPPISSFNARAIASLAEVASSTMTRRLPNILNALMDSIILCKDEELRIELNTAFDSVILSVDEYDGLNTMMSVMLALIKHDDHRRRAMADLHIGNFFRKAEIDFSRYYPDLIRCLLISFDDRDTEVVKAAWEALTELTKRMRKEEMESLVQSTRQVLQGVGVAGSDLPGFSLPKGIGAVLPIFLQGLMNGTSEQRTQAALAISDIIDRTNAEALRPYVTQITGPLIRVVSERSTEVKAAILLTLNNLLEKIPTYLKPFLPQLQRTFAKSLADTSSDLLRIRAAKALGTLITLTPRVDPLIAELVTGSKTPDAGVKNAMLKALYEVVSKAGANMNEASRTAILGLIDADSGDHDDATDITNARLLGAMIKVLPAEAAAPLIKNRVLTNHFSHPSILALNATLVEAPEALTESYAEETAATIRQGIESSQPFIADNAILAAGKYMLTPSGNKSFEVCKPLLEALANSINPGKPNDSRRFALVVVRTVSRLNNDLVRPHIPVLTPPIFASVRDMIIPVKLAAEAAFLALFCVVDEESTVFDKYLAGPGASLPPNTKRSLQDYFKRVVLRLASQARERKEAEGGAGGLGLSSDEADDEAELWSVGRVDLGEGTFGAD